MFDLTSGKLLLLGIVALIVLGPKDFPILLRTIGKYMGIIKRQADEFREQFNDAIRESEFDQIKKDVENLGQDLNKTMQDTQSSINNELNSVTQEFETVRHDIDAQLNDPLKPSAHTDPYMQMAVADPPPATDDTAISGQASTAAVPDPDAHDADGIPVAGPAAPDPVREHAVASNDRGLNGSGAHAEPARTIPEPAPKSGA